MNASMFKESLKSSANVVINAAKNNPKVAAAVGIVVSTIGIIGYQKYKQVSDAKKEAASEKRKLIMAIIKEVVNERMPNSSNRVRQLVVDGMYKHLHLDNDSMLFDKYLVKENMVSIFNDYVTL